MLAIQEEAVEFRMLGTSPVFSKDYFSSSFADFIPPYLEDNVAAEVHVGSEQGFSERDFIYSESISATTSCGTSVTSEISDDSFIDINDEDFDPFPKTETISLDFQSLQRLSESGNTGWSRSNTCKGSDAQDSSDSDDDDDSLPRGLKCAPEIPRTKSLSNKSECVGCKLKKRMDNISWNDMTSDDQMEAIEYLTRLASTTLGLHDQLEIIRIISPSARVLPTDTEFVIDLDAFNDSKFQRIQQYVCQRLNVNDCNRCSALRRSKCSRNSSTSLTHRKHSKRSRQPLSTKRISKKSKKPKGVLGRVHRQMEKEKRSGLFQKEEVITLKASAPKEDSEDEIEIDIL
ncbi:predicted protein [Nematostella vectensis]|uniref:Uncharacterized protein n=1 Tax=Nematostella vectensis TaxID=45351 RepID=A7S5V8_NEMVE|nr:protein FAM199X [Nematostella vectensis]EDO40871.1 predicted protein [Nematostella vectensis]|eukprot:XP_001632934.1 predicted protein [Nematostella vectensis]